jgi:hypothetical protein
MQKVGGGAGRGSKAVVGTNGNAAGGTTRKRPRKSTPKNCQSQQEINENVVKTEVKTEVKEEEATEAAALEDHEEQLKIEPQNC